MNLKYYYPYNTIAIDSSYFREMRLENNNKFKLIKKNNSKNTICSIKFTLGTNSKAFSTLLIYCKNE